MGERQKSGSVGSVDFDFKYKVIICCMRMIFQSFRLIDSLILIFEASHSVN